MKQEIKLIYESKYDDAFGGHCGTPKKIEMTLDGSMDLPDLLESFDAFIKAVGYAPPAHSTLDYVKNNDEQPY